MKKFFMTMMTIITVFAVGSVFTSCQSDDDDILPVTTESSSTSYTYSFEYILSDDILELYDVQVTRYMGTQVAVYNFDKAATIQNEFCKCSGMTCGKDIFKSEKGEQVSIVAKVTLKSNWQEIIASKDEIKLMLSYFKKTVGRSDSNVVGGTQDKGRITEEYLQKQAIGIQGFISFNAGSK